MEFHEKLQELRKQKALTQEELARELFVSRTAVSKWESGRGYPGLDSLKALAGFFSVTVDELLSGEEILSLARDDQQNKQQHFRDLVFGLLDIGMALLFFLPLFGQEVPNGVQSVSLPALTAVPLYLKSAYWLVAAAPVFLGILTLALQNCRNPLWVQGKHPLSLALTAAGVLLFILGRQPYAAILAFVFLMIKALIRCKPQ